MRRSGLLHGLWSVALLAAGVAVAAEHVERRKLGRLRGLEYDVDCGAAGSGRIAIDVLARLDPRLEQLGFALLEDGPLVPRGAPRTTLADGEAQLRAGFVATATDAAGAVRGELPLVAGGSLLARGSDLLPLPSATRANLPIVVRVRAAAGQQVLALTPERALLLAAEQGGARLELAADELASLVLLVAPLEPLAALAPLALDQRGQRGEPSAETFLLSSPPSDAAGLARSLAAALDALAERLPATPADRELFVVAAQTSADLHLPELHHGNAHLLPVTEGGWRSWHALVQRVAFERLRRRHPLAEEQAWLLEGVAARLADRVLPELLHVDEPRLQRDRWAAYGFYAPTREAPLATRRPRGNDRYFLHAVKAPLFLRQIERAARRPEPDAWLDVLARVADGARPDEAVTEVLGAAAGALYRAARGGELALATPDDVPSLLPEPTSPAPVPPALHELTLALTADTENFLETCGCKLRQEGGIARRAHVLERERARRPVLALDLGNLAPNKIEPFALDGFLRGEIGLHLRAALTMGYAGFALGPNELLFGAELLESLAAETGVRFSSCNVAAATGAATGSAPWDGGARVVELGGLTVALIGVTTTVPYWLTAEELERHASDVLVQEPLDGVTRALAAAPPSDVQVVFGQIPPWKIAELLARHPEIDVVASSDRCVAPGAPGARVPGLERFFLRSGFHGATFVALADEESHGLALFRLSCADDGRVVAFEEELVALSSDLPEEAHVRALMDEHYAHAPASGLPPGVEPLFADQRAERELVAGGPNGYVGGEACRACHAQAWDNWSRTPHARAFATLVERGRERSPKCVVCHVAGFGHPSGYDLHGSAQAERLRDVQCETCHGPGREHVADPTAPGRIRPTLDLALCEQCHDAEHSAPLQGRAEQAFAIGAHRGSTPTPED